MNKLLVFAVLMGVALAGFATGDVQTINGEVPKHISFDLLTPTLNYESVIPGATSGVKETTIRVNEPNNVDFTMAIKLTDKDTSGIFENVYLQDPDTLEYTDQLILDTPVERIITDTSPGVSFEYKINSVLKVPINFGPVSGASGTVTYIIVGPYP